MELLDGTRGVDFCEWNILAVVTLDVLLRISLAVDEFI